jgi:hypothetical protein
MKLDNYEKAMLCAIISIAMPIFAFFVNWSAVILQAVFFIGLLYYQNKIKR